MYKKTFMIFVLVFVMIIAPNNLAYAQDQTQDSGGQFDYEVHGPKGQVLYVKEYITISPSGKSPIGSYSPTLAASGCSSYTLGKNYYNATKVLVVSYSQKIDWCYNGTKITSVSHQHLAEVYHFLYRYNGIIGNNHSGGVGTASFRAFSQASFCEYAPLVGCVWNIYPWVEQTVYKNGSYGGSTGG